MPLPQTAGIETSREALGLAPSLNLTHEHISPHTPMGANLVGAGATFRVWAPRAKDVYLVLGSGAFGPYAKRDADRLTKLGEGHWAGFAPGVVDGQQYEFFVVGEGGEGYKRDPYARELTSDPGYPHSNCVVRDPGRFPWHDADHRTPDFSDLVVYQLHAGTFYGPDRGPRGQVPRRPVQARPPRRAGGSTPSSPCRSSPTARRATGCRPRRRSSSPPTGSWSSPATAGTDSQPGGACRLRTESVASGGGKEIGLLPRPVPPRRRGIGGDGCLGGRVIVAARRLG